MTPRRPTAPDRRRAAATSSRPAARPAATPHPAAAGRHHRRSTTSDWRAPSRLPGWSRGHVATHLARQADALRRLADGAHAGEPGGDVRRARAARRRDRGRRRPLRASSCRSTSTPPPALLEDAFEAVRRPTRWDVEVELRGGLRAPGPAAAAGPAATRSWCTTSTSTSAARWPTSTTPPPTGCWSCAPSGCAARRVPPAGAASPTTHARLGRGRAPPGPSPRPQRPPAGLADRAGRRRRPRPAPTASGCPPSDPGRSRPALITDRPHPLNRRTPMTGPHHVEPGGAPLVRAARPDADADEGVRRPDGQQRLPAPHPRTRRCWSTPPPSRSGCRP